MFNRRVFVALAVCLCTFSLQAFAGGNGGTKKNSTVRVVNNTDTPVFAFVNVSDTTLNNIANAADPQQAALNAGGKLIAAGGNEVKFSVKSGNNTVTVATATETPAIILRQTVTTGNGQTKTVTVTSTTPL